MTFASTYSSGSIRGWQSLTSTPIFTQSQELLPNLSNPNVENFGTSVSMSYDGNYLAIGETDFNGPNTTPGRTIIYNKDNITNEFVSQQTLTPNNFTGAAWLFFGRSVSLNYNGTSVVVGAPGYNSTSNAVGATYVFNRSGTTWTQQANLSPSDANAYSFGAVVASNYSGNLIAVGSQDNETANQSGAVFLFAGYGSSWTKIQKLKAGNVAAGQQFGSDIAISKDNNANYIAISAPGENAGQGTVYVFNKSGNTYVQQQRLTKPTGGRGLNFGRSLAINDYGNILLVGSPEEGITGSGRVYAYTRIANTWTLSQTIFPNAPNNSDSFGSAVSLNASGNVAFIGDPAYLNGNTLGAVYTFERISSYAQNQLLLANNGSNGDAFGSVISCDGIGSNVAIGAPNNDVGNIVDAGTVYIFTS